MFCPAKYLISVENFVRNVIHKEQRGNCNNDSMIAILNSCVVWL